MGCDIHLHAEIKINGKWEHYNHINVPRNYLLFGLMAGVRDDSVTPIAPRRGLPSDMSIVTALDYEKNWKGNAHSASWLSAEEIHLLAVKGAEAGMRDRDLQDGSIYWHCKYFGYLFGNSYHGFVEFPDERPESVEDMRFVFWFDN